MKTKIKFEVFGDMIVVDPKFKEKTEGGVILPEALQEQQMDPYMEVVAVGPIVKSEVNVGDFLTFPISARPNMIIVEDIKYLVFKEYEVLGKRLN